MNTTTTIRTLNPKRIATAEAKIYELQFGVNVFRDQNLPLPNSPNSQRIMSNQDLHGYIENYLDQEFTEISDTVFINTMEFCGREYLEFKMPILILGREMARDRESQWYVGRPTND